MPRLTLVTPTSHPPLPCPLADMREIIAELRAARGGTMDGPAILWLVNDLMLCCERRCDDFGDETPATAEEGAAALAREEFLARLTKFADEIRRSNGELSTAFMRFLDTAPAAMGDYTTN
ncbi:hypothetical protein [Maricaulis sp.]|uniref:hypothetical protein n=1 Tax=Maricaulis sp. TaxID=1486257 RepID=UPI003A94313F